MPLFHKDDGSIGGASKGRVKKCKGGASSSKSRRDWSTVDGATANGNGDDDRSKKMMRSLDRRHSRRRSSRATMTDTALESSNSNDGADNGSVASTVSSTSSSKRPRQAKSKSSRERTSSRRKLVRSSSVPAMKAPKNRRDSDRGLGGSAKLPSSDNASEKRAAATDLAAKEAQEEKILLQQISGVEKKSRTRRSRRATVDSGGMGSSMRSLVNEVDVAADDVPAKTETIEDKIRRKKLERRESSLTRSRRSRRRLTVEDGEASKERIRQELIQRRSMRDVASSASSIEVGEASNKERIRQELNQKAMRKSIGNLTEGEARKDKIRQELNQRAMGSSMRCRSMSEEGEGKGRIRQELDQKAMRKTLSASTSSIKEGRSSKLGRRQMLNEKVRSKSLRQLSSSVTSIEGGTSKVDRRQKLNQKVRSKSMRRLSSSITSVEEGEVGKLDRRQMLDQKVRSKSMRRLSSSITSFEEGEAPRVDRRQKLDPKVRSKSARHLVESMSSLEREEATNDVMYRHEPTQKARKKSTGRLSKSVSSAEGGEAMDDMAHKPARRLSKSVSSADGGEYGNDMIRQDLKEKARRKSRKSLSRSILSADGGEDGKDLIRQELKEKAGRKSMKSLSRSVSSTDGGEAVLNHKTKGVHSRSTKDRRPSSSMSPQRTSVQKERKPRHELLKHRSVSMSDLDHGMQNEEPQDTGTGTCWDDDGIAVHESNNHTCAVCNEPKNIEGLNDDTVQPSQEEQAPLESSDKRGPSVVHVTEPTCKMDDSKSDKSSCSLSSVGSSKQWECTNCTFMNVYDGTGDKDQPCICKMCDEPKIPGSWTCKKCTFFNEQEGDEPCLFCKVCDEPNEQCALNELSLLKQISNTVDDDSSDDSRPELDTVEEKTTKNLPRLFTGLKKGLSRRKKGSSIRWECKRCSYRNNDELATFCGSCGKSLVKVPPKKSSIK